MKFIVSTTTLLKSLQVISGVIKGGSVLPILDDFLFELNGEKLTVSATDLNISMRNTIMVESKESGSIAIPARLLSDTLKALPEQPLTFKIDTKTLAIEITSETGRYKLSGDAAEDFPKFPTPEKVSGINIPAGVLSNAIAKTLFAVSSDELRPAMTGILFEISTDGIAFVSTNGHTLVKITRSDVQADKEAQLIVPKKAAAILKASLPASDNIVSVTFNKSNVFFGFGSIVLIARLIDANYPAYNAVIPQNNPNNLKVSRLELLSAVKRIALYSNSTTYQTVLTIDGSELKVSSADLDYDKEATERLTCGYQGEDMAIGFNARFLIDALGVLDSSDIEIDLSTTARAGILRPDENEENEQLMILIMPVVVN